MAASTQSSSRPLEVDADLRRRTEEFLGSNPMLSKKLDELDRVLMAHFLQTQLQDERNGWRGTLAKAIEELERHRKMTLKATGGSEEYQLRRQFTDFMDEDTEEEEKESASGELAGTDDGERPAEALNDEAAQRLQVQLEEARDEASAAAELAWHYENFIRELKAINTKLEARLTQLVQERRRCLRLLPPLPGGPDVADLYKAIRELQNRHEQQALERQEPPREQPLCASCGLALSTSQLTTPPGYAATQQPQQDERQPQQANGGGAGTVVGWKRGRMFGNGVSSSTRPPPAAEIAIVPLRPPRSLLEAQQPPEQPQPQPQPAVVDPSLPERLAEAQAEGGRLRKDLRAMAKALRAAEDDAKEKAERLAAYEKQVAAMKHAFTYRQQQPPQPQDAVADPGGSLPVLNLRHTHKRPSQQLQQPPLSERGPAGQQQPQQQHVMPAKTSVTRCLRCQKLYRLVDNNKFACKYHSKGKQRREQHNSQGKLADVLFVWDCCGRLANAEGCCYSEHI